MLAARDERGCDGLLACRLDQVAAAGRYPRGKLFRRQRPAEVTALVNRSPWSAIAPIVPVLDALGNNPESEPLLSPRIAPTRAGPWVA